MVEYMGIQELQCADNRGSTVLSSFIAAVQVHGLPERIRTDLGGENVSVWRYMAAVITGSSTHNERIEHFLHDVYRCVGSLYHDSFQKLEEEGCLNPLNETDMYCLHYVFLPSIHWSGLLSPGTTTRYLVKIA